MLRKLVLAMQRTTFKPTTKNSRTKAPLRVTRVKLSPIARALQAKAKVSREKKSAYSVVVHFGEQNVLSTEAPGKLSLINLKLWLKQKYKSITKAIVTLHDYSTTELSYPKPRSRKPKKVEPIQAPVNPDTLAMLQASARRATA